MTRHAAEPADAEPIDACNDNFVGVQSGHIIVSRQPAGRLSIDRALRLAAWIVVCAEAIDPDAANRFERIVAAARNT